MPFKFTRETELLSLTATNAKQSAVLSDGYRKIIIRVPTSNAIRVAINGNPESLTGLNGLIVNQSLPLEISNHVINSIDYIRDDGESGDVDFQILGMW